MHQVTEMQQLDMHLPRHCTLQWVANLTSALVLSIITVIAGLQAGHSIAKPKPVFARLEGDYVTSKPDVPKELAGAAKK